MVGFLKKLTGTPGAEETEVEEYLDTLGLENEDFMEEEADVWIKPFILEDVGDATVVQDELSNGNIVLLNIEPLMKRNAIKLKQTVNKIKNAAKSLDGDIARLSEYKLLVTPKGIKVSRK
ncbi:MAG: cell division protein SepF [Candidatus Diapherotrites archaeon]|nr:cell division protein SepF [Candidatus Diapherotrites archaeon]